MLYCLKYSDLFIYLNLQIDLFMNTFASIFDFEQAVTLYSRQIESFFLLQLSGSVKVSIVALLHRGFCNSVKKTKLYVYKVNVFIDGERQIFFKFIIQYLYSTSFFSSKTQKKILPNDMFENMCFLHKNQSGYPDYVLG